MNGHSKPNVSDRITAYLSGGGLFNHLANHEAVRDLLIDCRESIAKKDVAIKIQSKAIEAFKTHFGMDRDEWTEPTFIQAEKAIEIGISAL